MNKWKRREFLDKLWLGYWIALGIFMLLALAQEASLQ